MRDNSIIVKRNSNIELLRIIAMLMVVILHCLFYSGALNHISKVYYLSYWWIEALCIVAVDVFVLISGYFMIETKFNAKSIFRILGGVWAYSAVFGVISIKVSGGNIFSANIIRAIFPIVTKKYWFVNSYLLLYILSPFLNKLIKVLTKRHFTLLVV